MKEYEKRKLFPLLENKFRTHKKNTSKNPDMGYDANIISLINKLYIRHIALNADVKHFGVKASEVNEIKLGTLLIDLFEFAIDIWMQRNNTQVSFNTLEKDIFEAFDLEKIYSVLFNNINSQKRLYSKLKYLHHIFLCIKDINDNVNFQKAKKIFFEELNYLTSEKREIYYSFLVTIGIERLNLGMLDEVEDLFFIINKRLKEGFTVNLESKDLSLNNFLDYIQIGLFLNNLKWVNNFLKNYLSYLHKDIRKDVELYVKAILKFKAKEYKSSNELLSKINRKSPYLYIDVYVLKLKILFELKLYDECHDELKNMNEYLRKERSVKDLLIIYSKSFCKAYALLLTVIQNPSDKKINELQFLLSNNLMLGKKWISEKLVIVT
ncbi:MAG TPA: hypothetical protein PKC58_17250 [Ignavibacteria bacterium]|nr:hypothetical protein [Ignavibacteria bacterium]